MKEASLTSETLLIPRPPSSLESRTVSQLTQLILIKEDILLAHKKCLIKLSNLADRERNGQDSSYVYGDTDKSTKLGH